jgi:uncharacterized membrane protein
LHAYLPLIGVGGVVLGFVAGINPLIVVIAAALASGIAGGLDAHSVIAAFGKAFNDNRFVSLTWLVLPAIGALERAGLQERAREMILKIRGAGVASILCSYMLVREGAAAVGLNALGGHAAMVRPLIAPMAEAAAEARSGGITDHQREAIRAHSAAAENVAWFFGEDVFVAVGSILLIKGVLAQNGIDVDPLQLSFWAIPTAISAYLIHAGRIVLFARGLKEHGR